jgi:predicted  nucleic acid-binding Zn-ribbon protein
MLVLVGAVGLLVGGCGGGGGGGGSEPLSKPEYVKQMTAIGRSLSTSISSLGAPSSAKEAATGLAKVQSELRDAEKQLQDITPPDDVKSAHEDLTKAVGDFADELDPIIEKLNSGNLKALSAVTTLKAFGEIQNAANAITKAGYKING